LKVWNWILSVLCNNYSDNTGNIQKFETLVLGARLFRESHGLELEERASNADKDPGIPDLGDRPQ
jgi:hypothetical protein